MDECESEKFIFLVFFTTMYNDNASTVFIRPKCILLWFPIDDDN